MNSAELRIRVGTADDSAAIADLPELVFHHPGPEARDIEGSAFEPERSLVATDGGWHRMPNPIEVF